MKKLNLAVLVLLSIAQLNAHAQNAVYKDNEPLADQTQTVWFTNGVSLKLTDLFIADELVTINVMADGIAPIPIPDPPPLPQPGGVNAPSNSTITWTIDTTDVAQANALRYKLYIDNVASPLTHKCDGSTRPFTCTAPLPVMTAGNHNVDITAANDTGEGNHSLPITVSYILAIPRPENLKIVIP